MTIAIGNRVWRIGVAILTSKTEATEIGVEIVVGSEAVTTVIGVGILRTGAVIVGEKAGSIGTED